MVWHSTRCDKVAKLLIDLPAGWEAKVEVKEYEGGHKQVVITPTFVRGSVSALCGYMTTEGKAGAHRRSMLMLNGNTGWPEVRRVAEHEDVCQFDTTDKPKDDKEDAG